MGMFFTTILLAFELVYDWIYESFHEIKWVSGSFINEKKFLIIQT